MVTQTDIDNLNAAIASGTRAVTLNGQSITYNNVDDLIKARNDLQARLNTGTAGKRQPKQTYVYQDGRGYD